MHNDLKQKVFLMNVHQMEVCALDYTLNLLWGFEFIEHFY